MFKYITTRAFGLLVPTNPTTSSPDVAKPIKPPVVSSTEIKKIMKRAQTPEGMVVHYENKLHNFLGLQQSPVDSDDNEWLFVDPDCIPQHIEETPHTLKGDKKINAAAKGAKHFDNPVIAQGIRDNMVSEWPLQDSYARLVVHTMCRYYGLVSFTSHNGKSNVLHICHPKLFNSSEAVVLPEISFHQFLFGSKN